MPRGPSKGWNRRKPPITDNYIQASIDKAGGHGNHDPATGHYAEIIIRGFDSLEGDDGAREFRASLFRCAWYMTRHGTASVSADAKIERDGDGYKIRFKAIDKIYAVNHHLKTHGTDRSKWAYDPRRRGA